MSLTLTILDATETSLTFACPPPISPTTIQYKAYGEEWPGEEIGVEGGEVTIEGLLPANTVSMTHPSSSHRPDSAFNYHR